MQRVSILIEAYNPNPARKDGKSIPRKSRQSGGEDKTIDTANGTVYDPTVTMKNDDYGSTYYAYNCVTALDVVNPALEPPYNNKGKEGIVWLNSNVVDHLVNSPRDLKNATISVPMYGSSSFTEASSKQTNRFENFTLFFTIFDIEDIDEAILQRKEQVAINVQTQVSLDLVKQDEEAKKRRATRLAGELRAQNVRAGLLGTQVHPESINVQAGGGIKQLQPKVDANANANANKPADAVITDGGTGDNE